MRYIFRYIMSHCDIYFTYIDELKSLHRAFKGSLHTAVYISLSDPDIFLLNLCEHANIATVYG